ncbi:Multidrug resistance-associated protein 1 [Nymphon striatum]|nr:Multidrug resistance-associated protein 1 [Nymphon striatum]
MDTTRKEKQRETKDNVVKTGGKGKKRHGTNRVVELNNDLTWYTSNPDFTKCFQSTVLSWIPVAIILICTPFEVLRKKHNDFIIPWNLYNISMSIITLLLGVLNLALFVVMVLKFRSSDNVQVSLADVLAPIFLFCAQVAAFSFKIHQQKHGVVADVGLFVFWFFMFICDLIKYRSSIMILLDNNLAVEINLVELGCTLAMFPLTFSVFCMLFIADIPLNINDKLSSLNLKRRKKYGEGENFQQLNEIRDRDVWKFQNVKEMAQLKISETGEEDYSTCERRHLSSVPATVTNMWVSPFLRKGYIQTLSFDDVWTVPNEELSDSGLRLSNVSKQNNSVGEMVNLMAVDSQKFIEMLMFFPQFINAFLTFIIAVYILWGILGPSCLAGVAVLVILIPANGFSATIIKRYQRDTMVFSDARLKLINEILNGMKVLKLYAWEIPFADAIQRIRTDEIDNAIKIEDASFSWGDKFEEPTIKKVNLDIKHGSLVAVVGRVGSGKSSFLSAILGDMQLKSGKAHREESLAYVPQQAWIQNATVKNNITFYSRFKVSVYERVISACALLPDFELFVAGDATEIGEKGVNLSGGQKQRISLARAVYNDAKLYLLDDPLSAVDAHVGKHIFDEIIGPSGLLKNKTRIFATNSLGFLPKCDQIVVLKDGEITESGTYKELLSTNGAFSELILQYISEENGTTSDIEVLDEILEDTSASEQLKSNISRTRSMLTESYESSFSEKSLESKKKKKSNLKKSQNIKGRLVEVEEMEIGKVKLGVYVTYMKEMGAVVTAFLLSLFAALFLLSKGVLKASKRLHNGMLKSIIHSPMAFFDTTPIGRIMNRFSKDCNIMDVTLLQYFQSFSTFGSNLIASMIIIISQAPVVLIVIIPLFAVFVYIQKVYLQTSRQIKRIESVTRSPIYSLFSECASGANSIRAYGVNKIVSEEFNKKTNINHIAFYVTFLVTSWLEVCAGSMSGMIVIGTGILSVVFKDIIGPSAAGLAISFSYNLTGMLLFAIQGSADIETNIISGERIMEYTKLPSEAEWKNESSKPSIDWPDKGTVEFVNYQTKYRPELDLVLKGIDCNINAGEKIGICGRTGAGKSSMTLALFRIIEATKGTINIDGVDISKLGLHDLRSKLTIIPQVIGIIHAVF